MKTLKTPGIVLLLAFWVVLQSGCAVNFTKAGSQSDAKSSALYLKKQQKVLVTLPTVEESFVKKLEGVQWTGEKFSQELHQELSYQLGKKGIKVIADSSQTRSYITVHKYDPGSLSSPAKLEGYAVLKTETGQRRLEVPVWKKKQSLFETESEVIDNIRYLASNLASKISAKPRSRKDEPVYEPQMWVIF